MRLPSTSKGVSSAVRIVRAISSAAMSTSRPDLTSVANSPPSKRAISLDSPSVSFSRSATARSSRSPCSRPRESFTSFRRSSSM